MASTNIGYDRMLKKHSIERCIAWLLGRKRLIGGHWIDGLNGQHF